MYFKAHDDEGVDRIELVVEEREVVYPRKWRGDEMIDRGGRETEIVREKELCPGCAKEMK